MNQSVDISPLCSSENDSFFDMRCFEPQILTTL